LASPCPPALQLLAVTVRVLELGPLLAAGDLKAAAEVEAMAALLEGGNRG
jgi:hypothetical protein